MTTLRRPFDIWTIQWQNANGIHLRIGQAKLAVTSLRHPFDTWTIKWQHAKGIHIEDWTGQAGYEPNSVSLAVAYYVKLDEDGKKLAGDLVLARTEMMKQKKWRQRTINCIPHQFRKQSVGRALDPIPASRNPDVACKPAWHSASVRRMNLSSMTSSLTEDNSLLL